MKPTNRFLSLAVTAFCVAATSSAAEETKLPPLQKVLDRFIEASGGAETIKSLKSLALKGDVTSPMFGSAKWQMLAKAPNKRLMITSMEGMGDMKEGFDGKVAWTSSPFTGLVVKEGAEAEKAARDADFYRDLHMTQTYPGLHLVRADKVGDEPVWVAEAAPVGGMVERFFFSQKSGYIIQHESVPAGSQQGARTVTRFSDFRRIDGQVIPHSMEIQTRTPDGNSFTIQLKITEVSRNVPLDDSLFAKPQA